VDPNPINFGFYLFQKGSFGSTFLKGGKGGIINSYPQ